MPQGFASLLHVGWDTGDLPSQGENYGHRTPPGPCVLHGGTPEALNRRHRVVAPEAPQYPLTPSGWHALRAGVWQCRRRVGVVAVSCGRVVALVAAVPREKERTSWNNNNNNM